VGEDPDRIRREIEQTRAEMSETVDAIGYKADVKSRAKDRASDAVGTVKQGLGIAQENPLGLAVGAVAAGFLVGLAVPSSDVEHEKLGPVADRVKDQAKETGQEALDRGKEVAQSAADTVSEEGRKHGEKLADSAKENAASVR
jgi:gas vesicle protein